MRSIVNRESAIGNRETANGKRERSTNSRPCFLYTSAYPTSTLKIEHADASVGIPTGSASSGFDILLFPAFPFSFLI
ncbi:hypothetical protein A4R26_12890 [Niastella populi]|uniref:Uncharacterized protein n=1 Tax=Niastella populi TaxID=550983 RepID=A0A1V9G7W7_9BACT|nr:hypothetical protein A4R26_12890 [Niastella populi]